MASADIYGGLITFLEDASDNTPGDVRTTINGEISSLIANNCVFTSRQGRSGQRLPRRDPSPNTTVEIVPLTPPPSREVGIGMVERSAMFDLRFTYRAKDQSQGKAQFLVAKNVARALVARYNGMSVLNITVPGNLATFCWSTAEIHELDDTRDTYELIRSVVRCVFVFTEAMGVNE